MWNLFKEKEEPVKEVKQDVIVLEKPKKGYPAVVLEIHREFETSADKLLKQALDAVNSVKPVISEEKAKLLKKYGFNKVEEVVKQEAVNMQVEFSKKQIDTIKYYRQNYPFNKFIFPDQVKEICNKYNLVFGGVSAYKGFVPEKNLREIDNFKLKEEDYRYVQSYRGDSWTSELTYEQYQEVLKSIKDENTGDIYRNHVHITKNENLQICAPIHDMDTTNKNLVDGYKLEDIPLDPVVLMPVRGGGYLIVTCWGDEASDPLVLNETLN